MCTVAKINITYVSYEPIGDSWIQRFLQRDPGLHTAMSDAIEASRIQDITVEMVVKWFKVFKEVDEYKILYI